jgi:phosphatidylserine/phosphatidylglycerophosphate/cardiolipin synthase-like enzyme
MRAAWSIAAVVAGLAANASFGETPPVLAAKGTVQAAFTPWDDAEAVIVGAIRDAKQDIRVQAFSFTSRSLASALIAASRRGVDVRVIADSEQAGRSEGSRLKQLAAAGVKVLIDSDYQSAHNKVMLMDAGGSASAVVTGSYNWTYAARSRNAENVLVLRGNPELARAYLANWERHAVRAQPLRVSP